VPVIALISLSSWSRALKGRKRLSRPIDKRPNRGSAV